MPYEKKKHYSNDNGFSDLEINTHTTERTWKMLKKLWMYVLYLLILGFLNVTMQITIKCVNITEK